MADDPESQAPAVRLAGAPHREGEGELTEIVVAGGSDGGTAPNAADGRRRAPLRLQVQDSAAS